MSSNVNTPLKPGASLRRYGGGQQPTMRLVCFSWCGAGASVYRKLARGLPEHIELLAVQLPGREERFGEPCLRRMEQVIDMLIEEIAPLADRPLMLFGHSMGALVAYEMARALKTRMAREPSALIVSGHGAPDSEVPSRRIWHTERDAEFLDHIGQMDGTPPAVLANQAMMTALIPVLRADFEVLETYVHKPGPALSCPLFVCAGHADEKVSGDGLAAWAQYSSGSCTVHWFQGGHFYLNTQPRALTRRIEQWAADAPCRAAPPACITSRQVDHEYQ